MTLQQLIDAGLTEEQATKILQMHKEGIDGNYVPKATFDAEREKVKNLNTEVSNRDTQIKELGKFKGTAEDLEIKVSELEENNKIAKQEYDLELTRITNEATIKSEIGDKVIDIDDVLPRLNLDKIKFNKDGKIESGLDDQLESLKEAKPHYFPKAESTKNNPPEGWIFGKKPVEGSSGEGATDPAADFGKQLAQSKLGNMGGVEDPYFK